MGAFVRDMNRWTGEFQNEYVSTEKALQNRFHREGLGVIDLDFKQIGARYVGNTSKPCVPCHYWRCEGLCGTVSQFAVCPMRSKCCRPGMNWQGTKCCLTPAELHSGGRKK